MRAAMRFTKRRKAIVKHATHDAIIDDVRWRLSSICAQSSGKIPERNKMKTSFVLKPLMKKDISI
jgi:hypothetical protein